MSQRNQRAPHPPREAPPQSPQSSTHPATPANQHGFTSTWTGATTHVRGQISISLPWLHPNWPRRERRRWRKPRGKQSRKQGKRRRERERGKKSGKESESERRKQSELRKPPVPLMRAEWENLRWLALLTCVHPSMAPPPQLQLCHLTSDLTLLPFAPSASTLDHTSCPQPIGTTPSLCPSTPLTPYLPITCQAYTMLTPPCESESYESGRCEKGRFVRGSFGRG